MKQRNRKSKAVVIEVPKMTQSDFVETLLCLVAGVPVERVKAKQLTKEDFGALFDASELVHTVCKNWDISEKFLNT